MTEAQTSVPSVMIRASAGSGKTFSLANRFIALLALGISPDRILASTFTKKAAGEILSRVFMRLAQAALDAEKAEQLYRQLAGEFTPDQHRQVGASVDFRLLLKRLISLQHRLVIGTLDSFFLQTAKCFSAELGFPDQWAITDEPQLERLRLDAIAEALAGATPDETSTLIQILSARAVKRSVIDQIRFATRELESLYRETDISAWNWFEPPPPPSEGDYKRALQRLTREREGLQEEKKPPKRLIGALEKLEQLCAERNWGELLKTTLAKNVSSGNPTFSSKPLAPDLAAVIEVLVAEAKSRLLWQLRQRTLSTYQVNLNYHRALDRLKLDSGLLYFNDIAWRLAEAALGERTSELYYRLDCRVSHILLDEFQDTSLLQWQVLLPLVDEVLQNPAERSFFCVGDVKQAIYGWRGGCAELFDDLAVRHPSVACRELNKSFRSSPAIIDFVNELFAGIACTELAAAHPRSIGRWLSGFSPHRTAREDLAGHVQVRTCRNAAEGRSQQDENLCEAAELVQTLAQQYPDKSIGVLLRRNSTARRLLARLRSDDIGLDASEEGGNPLTDSAAVRLLLALLEVADSPKNTAAAYHLSISPLRRHLELAAFDDEKAVAHFAAALRRELQSDGYGPVLQRVAGLLAPEIAAQDRLRVEQLVDLAYRRDQEAPIRPIEFVEQVKRTKVESLSEVKIRVMTIHGSKGLEFDIVVLPELDQKLAKVSSSLPLKASSSPLLPPERVLCYPNKELRALEPELAELYEKNVDEVARESLSVLYVAVTRAVHALYMLLSPAGSPAAKSNCNLQRLICAALSARGVNAAPELPEQSVLYERGTADWRDSK